MASNSETKRLSPAAYKETAFEKGRGIEKIEVRKDQTEVHAMGLAEPVMATRVEVLRAIADSGVSIDFLKLTPNGMSFVVLDSDADSIAAVLAGFDVQYELLRNRHIVLVHAVNMRDEEGLIADVMSRAIRSGVKVRHVADMHDRMLLVVDADESAILVEGLEGVGRS